jgi:hypothetical protein
MPCMSLNEVNWIFLVLDRVQFRCFEATSALSQWMQKRILSNWANVIPHCHSQSSFIA